MICQICNINEATVHFTRIINNNKVEMFVCDRCAKENSNIKISINQLLSGILGYDSSGLVTKHSASEACPNCGMTIPEFNKIGKMGCDKCYETFETSVQTLLKRMQGNVNHSGKMPKKLSVKFEYEKEISELKNELRKCIETEAYEKAAELRDKIKEIEKERGVTQQ